MGVDWLEWEPDVLRAELLRVFRQPSIHSANWEMLQAARTCLLATSPWKTWEVFALVCQAFNNNIPDFQSLQRSTPAQVTVCVDMMQRLGSHTFADPVERFIAACYLDESIDYLHPIVGFAQEWVTRPMYRCRRCGRVDHDDANGVCDSCGAPDTELERTRTRDPDPIKRRYDEIRAMGRDRPVLQETMEDIQTAKLLLIDAYVDYRRLQLKTQMSLIQEAP
jgi:ribosomal protein L37E